MLVPCINCTEDTKHYAKGLCWRCYSRDYESRNRTQRTLDKAEWRKNNPERQAAILERRVEKLRTDPDAAARARRAEKVRKYNLSDSDYTRLMAQTSCSICGSSKNLCIDHDHGTGKVRDMLCLPCNTALGHIEKPDWIEWAHTYLQKHTS